MKKSKLIAFLLAGAMALSLAACGGGGYVDDTGSKTDGGAGTGDGGSGKEVFTLADDEWYGTDLYQQDSWSSGQGLIADPIFTMDPKGGDLLDGICTDLTTSEDGLTMTMTVPEGKFYATGEQVEPEDVVASIEWGKEVSVYADGYSNIESMEVDGRQVILHLTEFRSDLLYYLGEVFMGVIDKDQLDSLSKDELMWQAVPYGMYSVESYEPGSGVTLVANEGYKTDNPLVENKGAPAIKRVEVKFNVEDFTAIEELKAGNIDYINGITMDGKRQLEAEDGITVAEKTYPNIDYFEMNTDKGAFADVAVRQAVALSINREALSELTDGAVLPAYSMIFDSMQSFSQEAKDYFTANCANDPERAKQILADAGYADSNGDGYVDKNGTNVEFTFYSWSTGANVIVSQGLQEQLKQVGIKMNIEALDWNYIYENINNDEYDAGIEWLEWAEPILILNACYYDQNAPGNTDDYYAAVADAAATVDADERIEKIGEIQKEMFANWNIIPFYSEATYVAYNNYVKGIEIFNGSLYWNDLSF